ncbi:hypothetical protein HRbin36_00453 [bacterium HR36]|nr:hypothetical protein HRbin36_00453 [bacterium HR36]
MLLVVVLFFLSLLQPVVYRARIASNTMRCGNNLRQIAIALHNYHNDFNIFPTGGGNAEQGRAFSRNGKAERNPPLGGKLPAGAQPVNAPLQEWGWAYQILPYIEQDYSWRLPEDDAIRQSVVPIYFCPVRRNPLANDKSAKGLKMAGIDYGGNGGLTEAAQALKGLRASDYKPLYGDYTTTGLVIRSSAWYPLKGPGLGRAVSLESVKDGTSNTILIAEKRMQTDSINRNPPNDDWSFVDGWGNDTIVRYHPEDEKLQPAQDSNARVPDFAMGSAHPKAFLAAFADISLRKIRYTAKPEALAAATVRDEGLPIKFGDLE